MNENIMKMVDNEISTTSTANISEYLYNNGADKIIDITGVKTSMKVTFSFNDLYSEILPLLKNIQLTGSADNGSLNKSIKSFSTSSRSFTSFTTDSYRLENNVTIGDDYNENHKIKFVVKTSSEYGWDKYSYGGYMFKYSIDTVRTKTGSYWGNVYYDIDTTITIYWNNDFQLSKDTVVLTPEIYESNTLFTDKNIRFSAGYGYNVSHTSSSGEIHIDAYADRVMYNNYDNGRGYLVGDIYAGLVSANEEIFDDIHIRDFNYYLRNIRTYFALLPPYSKGKEGYIVGELANNTLLELRDSNSLLDTYAMATDDYCKRLVRYSDIAKRGTNIIILQIKPGYYYNKNAGSIKVNYYRESFNSTKINVDVLRTIRDQFYINDVKTALNANEISIGTEDENDKYNISYITSLVNDGTDKTFNYTNRLYTSPSGDGYVRRSETVTIPALPKIVQPSYTFSSNGAVNQRTITFTRNDKIVFNGIYLNKGIKLSIPGQNDLYADFDANGKAIFTNVNLPLGTTSVSYTTTSNSDDYFNVSGSFNITTTMLPTPTRFTLNDGEQPTFNWDYVPNTTNVLYDLQYRYYEDSEFTSISEIGGTASNQFVLPSNFLDGKTIGNYYWRLRAKLNSTEEYNSGYTNEILMERNTLETPLINRDNCIVNFEVVANADVYLLTYYLEDTETIIKTQYIQPGYNTFNDIVSFEHNGRISYDVISTSNKHYQYADSERSEREYIETRRLDTPTWNYEESEANTFAFNVDNLAYTTTLYYSKGNQSPVELNDVESPKTIIFDEGIELYTLWLKSFPNGDTNPEVVLYESENSERTSYGSLPSITLYRDGGVLRWNDIDADTYVVVDADYIENGGVIGVVQRGVNALEIPNANKGIGSHTYYVTGTKNISEELYSSKSNNIGVNIQQIDTPVLTAENGTTKFSVNTENKEVTYTLYVNNIPHIINGSNINIRENTRGTYSIYAKATSTIDSFLFITSPKSNIITHNVYQAYTPTNITFDPTGDMQTFTWDAAQYAKSYDVYYDGNYYTNTIDTTFRIADEVGAHTFSIKSIGNEDIEYPSPLYLDSPLTNPIEFGVLETPIIREENGYIVWDEIFTASEYEIYNGSNLISTVNDNKYKISTKKTGSYIFTVVAINESEYMEDSAKSNTLLITVAKIEAPTNVRFRDQHSTILTWDVKTNANSYNIYINGIKHVNVITNSYDMQNVINYNSGKLTIEVVSVSNSALLLDSDKSLYINYFIPTRAQYEIVIGNNDEVITDIQLPFNISRNATDLMDTGNINIGYITRKEPYQMLEAIRITVTNTGSDAIKNVYNMLIVKDTVNEVMVGENSLYLHSLELIEKTALLQNEVLPTFSITQPTDVFKFNQPKIGQKVDYQLPDDREFLTNGGRGVYRIWYDIKAGTLSERDHFKLYGTVFNDWSRSDEDNAAIVPYSDRTQPINGELRNYYTTNESFMLPRSNGYIGYDAYYNYDWGLFDILKAQDSARMELPGPTVRYYYREVSKHPNRTNYKEDNIEEKSLIHKFNASPSDVISANISKAGKYDIILEIDNYDYKQASIERYTYGSSKVAERRIYDDRLKDIPLMMEKGFVPQPSIIPLKYEYENIPRNKLKPYRVVWRDIVIEDPQEVTVERPESLQTVYDVINKMCCILEPAENDGINIIKTESNGSYDIKYTFNEDSRVRYKLNESDATVMTILKNTNVPDLSVINGKTFYEVLRELGRLFNGIPRLVDNTNDETNLITYFINGKSTAFTEAYSANTFNDSSELEQTEMNLGRYTSGYVANLANLIPSDDYMCYPASNLWTAGSANEEISSTMEITSMVVKTDKPIYRLRALLVKNVLKDQVGAETEFNITPFIDEKTIFDTYSNLEQSKRLYYTQGQNAINNIGTLAELESVILKTIGQQSTEYVIERILKENWNIDSDDMNEPVDFLFKVYYYPYIDCVSFVEKDKDNGMKYVNYQNFNQDSSTIQDDRFGKSAITQIRRLGTDTITKTYVTDDYNDIPLLGYSMNVDGEPYYIDKVDYIFNTNKVESLVEYSSSYNKIDPVMTIDSTYREYELPQQDFVDRNISINEYVYITQNKPVAVERNENVMEIVKRALNANGDVPPTDKPTSFYLNCYDEDMKRLQYETLDDSGETHTKTVEGINIPATFINTGYSVQFNGKMETSFSAGSKIENYNDDNGNYKRRQKFVRYVGDSLSKQLTSMNITLAKTTETFLFNPYISKATQYASLPECLWKTNYDSIKPLYSNHLYINKDYREILNFNYQLHFKCEHGDNVYYGTGLTKRLFKRDLYFIDSASYSEIKVIGHNEDTTTSNVISSNDIIANINVVYEGNYLRIDFDDIDISKAYSGYSLVWNDTREIVIDVRDSIKAGQTTLEPIYIYFKSKLQ